MGTSDLFNDAADVRAELHEARAADCIEYLATQNPNWNEPLDSVVDAITEDRDALTTFVQFMAQRSMERPYATRKTYLAYEVAVAASVFVDRFLAAYAEKEAEAKS